MSPRKQRKIPKPQSNVATQEAFEELLRNLRNATSEQDFRLSILNALLRTPHRNVQPYIPLFRQVHDRDPLFFSRLAVWYCESGAVHDLKQLFISFLCTSKFSDEFREAGQALLDGLPPYQVERVFKMIKGHRDGTQFVAGIAPSVPRSFKTAVEQYLREREARPEQFDNVVLHARKSMKSLYASLRIKPSEYAQKVLFDNDPPEGSRLYVLKELAKTDDPVEQARLIIKSKLPYRIAVSAIKTVTPSVLVSLINAMTPQEVINNLSSLQARGAMDNPELRKLIDKKLESARGDKRVSALKTREAIKAASLDDEMAEKVASVGDAKIKTHGKIRKSTALLVDKSSSMDQAIEVGKQIASIFAPVCEADLYVYAFDTIAYPIKPKGNELSDWEKAFKGIIASGGTSCGVGIETLRRNKERVEQIIMVTDQEENTPPFMLDALRKYADDMKVQPDVLFVSVERFHSLLLKELTAAGIMTDNYAFTGDYYSLPGLIPLVSGGTRLDLLMEIMSRELPTKKVKATAI